MIYTNYTMIYTNYTMIYTNYTMIYTNYTMIYTNYTMIYTNYTMIYTNYTMIYTNYTMILQVQPHNQLHPGNLLQVQVYFTNLMTTIVKEIPVTEDGEFVSELGEVIYYTIYVLYNIHYTIYT